MGCDIHFVVEKKHKDKWIGVYTTDWEFQPVVEIYSHADQKSLTGSGYVVLKNRDYEFFAKLAGVRGDGPEANGVPTDASDLATMCTERWDADGHSHCHMPLREFVGRKASTPHSITKRTANKLVNGEEDLFKPFFEMNDYEDVENMRVIAWFDN